jgi:hypothetical protein
VTGEHPLKLVAQRDEPWTYNSLATELDLSPSQVHAAVQRAIKSDLAYETDDQVRVHVRNLEEFLDDDEPVVWPDSSGDVRGESPAPLYKSAPNAVRRDPELYELLVIADALRAGRTRENSRIMARTQNPNIEILELAAVALGPICDEARGFRRAW